MLFCFLAGVFSEEQEEEFCFLPGFVSLSLPHQKIPPHRWQRASEAAGCSFFFLLFCCSVVDDDAFLFFLSFFIIGSERYPPITLLQLLQLR